METFETRMGELIFRYRPYCIDCPRFEPYARSTCKTDEDGKVIWTADHQTIRNGVSISCVHEFVCQNVAYQLKERLKGENNVTHLSETSER